MAEWLNILAPVFIIPSVNIKDSVISWFCVKVISAELFILKSSNSLTVVPPIFWFAEPVNSTVPILPPANSKLAVASFVKSDSTWSKPSICIDELLKLFTFPSHINNPSVSIFIVPLFVLFNSVIELEIIAVASVLILKILPFTSNSSVTGSGVNRGVPKYATI